MIGLKFTLAILSDPKNFKVENNIDFQALSNLAAAVMPWAAVTNIHD